MTKNFFVSSFLSGRGVVGVGGGGKGADGCKIIQPTLKKISDDDCQGNVNGLLKGAERL